MEEQPKIIPVEVKDRLDAQKQALEELHKSQPGTGVSTGVEIDITLYVPALTAAFQNEFTVEEACSYAKLARRTYYNHLKKNQDFAEQMARAQAFGVETAKGRLVKIMQFGADRDAGPMVRWFLEKKQPELYGLQSLKPGDGGRTQNNFFFGGADIREFFKQPTSQSLGAKELSQILEEQPTSDTGGKEEITPSLHPAEVSNNDTNPLNLQGS